MKKDLLKNIKWKVAVSSLAALSLIVDLLLTFIKIDETGETLVKTASIWVNGFDYTGVLCFAMLMALLICMGMYIYSAIAVFLGKKMVLYPFALPFVLHVGFFVLCKMADFGGAYGTLLIICAVINIASLCVSILYSILFPENKNTANTKEKRAHLRALLLFSGVLSTVVTFSLLFVPFCEYGLKESKQYIIPMGVISAENHLITHLVIFFVTFTACICGFTSLVGCFRYYSDDILKLSDKVKSVLSLNFSFTGAYFVAGVTFASINNSKGANFTVNSYPPLVIMIAVALLYCVCVRHVKPAGLEMHARASRSSRVEFFIYSAFISIAAIGSALSDILKVTFPSGRLSTIRVNGLTILKSYNSIEAGLQMVAFLVLIVLVSTSVLFLASLLSLISGSKTFYKITLSSAITGISATFFIGLFGKYYEIVQKMNVSTIKNIIANVHGAANVDLAFKVQSQSFYWFLAAVAIMCVIILRRPYSKGTMSEAILEVSSIVPAEGSGDKPSADQPENTVPNEASVQEVPVKDTDPSPALTLIDKQTDKFEAELASVRDSAFKDPSLPALADFVVEYAKNSRLHLFYTKNDIAAFIAGLGATRLTILQGMSGTGKTSLPKIFTETIFGVCDIVEVESSWRDKNELLGYYNEFSRTYTPKKFTQALYKARLCPERLTFIVLDEMNLSRIEYYFSDFLSLMENEESKREIKLLNVALYRNEDQKNLQYLGLEDGHTIKVPANVWFIGTANRDESTFEISDKVYDRAHTMNFNKRARKINVTGEPKEQRYLSAPKLIELLENAKNTVRFDVDSSHVIKEVEELLAPYNISFGNRIANQIESFVSIYCSCFTDPHSMIDEALETILLSKVVAKLELRSIDNKEILAAEFSRLGLERCSEFIMSLHED